MKIDYSAFSQPVNDHTIQVAMGVPQSSSAKIMKKASKFIYTSIYLAAAVFFGINVYMLTQNRETHFEIVFYIVGIGLFTWIGSRYERHQQERLVRMYRFANSNGLQLKHSIKDPDYQGMIFGKGKNRLINEALLFPDGTEMGNYRYITDSGISSYLHKWSYVRIKLPRRLPHMILDAKKNNFVGSLSVFDSGFDRSQTLKLEGDFNKYFTLYAPKEYERDALYIFTPDVMAALIDGVKTYDIEIVDDDLFLYANGYRDLHTEEGLKKMLELVGRISSELRHQTDYYSDERIGDRSINWVDDPGQRLASKNSLTRIMLLLVILILTLSIFWWALSKALQ